MSDYYLLFALFCVISVSITLLVTFLHGSFGDVFNLLAWSLKITNGYKKGPFWNGLFLLLMLLPTLLPMYKMYIEGRKVDQLILLGLGLTFFAAEVFFLCSPSSTITIIPALK